jgi:hypothetical protein
LRGDDGRSTGGCKRVTTTRPPFFSSSIRFSLCDSWSGRSASRGQVGTSTVRYDLLLTRTTIPLCPPACPTTLTSVSIREEYAYPKSKLLRRIGRPLLFFDGSERVLYDLERLKLRIYEGEGVVQKMRSISSMLIDLRRQQRVRGGWPGDTISLSRSRRGKQDHFLTRKS